MLLKENISQPELVYSQNPRFKSHYSTVPAHFHKKTFQCKKLRTYTGTRFHRSVPVRKICGLNSHHTTCSYFIFPCTLRVYHTVRKGSASLMVCHPQAG